MHVQVMGVITRKDIAEANAKLALGRKANLGLTTPSDRLVRHGSLPFIPYGAYDPTVGYSSSRCVAILSCSVEAHSASRCADIVHASARCRLILALNTSNCSRLS